VVGTVQVVEDVEDFGYGGRLKNLDVVFVSS
jgi:hypothetical protein